MVRFQAYSLGNVEYPFIVITSRSAQTGVVVTIKVISMGQIERYDHLNV